MTTLSFQSKIRPVATSTGDTTKSAPTTAPVNNVSFASKIRPSAVAPTPVPQGDGMAMGMLKGIVSAPATMVARPIQAVQSAYHNATMNWGDLEKAKALNDQAYKLALTIRNAPPEQQASIRAQVTSLMDEANKNLPSTEDLNWQPSSGGVIAAAPKNMADVKKDVGRAVETIALGVPSPLASGAAFGFGSSLEQGNDVFSMETLKSTLLGMGAGKALDLIGKPLLNSAGTVIGTITPLDLQKVVSRGADAVSDFMSKHELLGGVAKPLSEKITKGAEVFDTKINKTASSLWKGTKKTIAGQYPNTQEKIAKHFEKIETDRMMPDKGGVYNKSRDVVADAKRRGVDINQKLKDNKIYADEHIVDGKYDTKATAEALEDEAKNGGAEFIRPALREADMGVKRTNIADVRNQIMNEIKNQPASSLSAEQKLSFMKKVAREYGDNSAEAAMYRNGYGLEDLYNSKLQRTSGLYKTPKSGGVPTISDKLTSQQKEIEAKVFDNLLRKNAPKEIGLDKYFKAQEEKFVLANYLRTIHGGKAPLSVPQRMFKTVSQLGGGTLGFKTFGPMGMFNGYQFGGLMSDTFMSIPNPVKISYLKSIGKTMPEIYQIMKEFVSDAEAKRMITPLLGPGEKIDINLGKLQGEELIKNSKGEWVKVKTGAIPMKGPENIPNKIANDVERNSIWLGNTKALNAPDRGIVLPNTQGTPNKISSLYNRGGDIGDVGGLRQKR